MVTQWTNFSAKSNKIFKLNNFKLTLDNTYKDITYNDLTDNIYKFDITHNEIYLKLILLTNDFTYNSN
jgi:hypothetical protein